MCACFDTLTHSLVVRRRGDSSRDSRRVTHESTLDSCVWTRATAYTSRDVEPPGPLLRCAPPLLELAASGSLGGQRPNMTKTRTEFNSVVIAKQIDSLIEWPLNVAGAQRLHRVRACVFMADTIIAAQWRGVQRSCACCNASTCGNCSCARVRRMRQLGAT